MERCVCSVCFRGDLTIKTVMVTSSLEMETFSALLAIVREIHRSPVNSLYKGKWPGALMFSLICAWMNSWVNNREAGDLRRHCAHYNITVMSSCVCAQILACHNYLRYPLFIYLCVWNYIHLKDLIVRRAGLLWSQQDFEWRWSVPLFKCLTVLEFSFILFDLCLLITFFNFIMNYVPIVTFWIFTYHKIWILSIMFCFIWSYWIIYFLACLEVSWRVVS